MKVILSIHNQGSQERAYGPSVKQAVIEIVDGPIRHNEDEVDERWFRDYFQRFFGEIPEEPDDWFVYQWVKVARLAPNTWALRAERPYDD